MLYILFLSRLELAGGYQALQGLQIQYAVREYIRVKYFKIYLIERSALPYKWSRAVKMRRWMNHIGSQVTAAAAAAAMLSHPSAPKCTQRCNEGPGQCSPIWMFLPSIPAICSEIKPHFTTAPLLSYCWMNEWMNESDLKCVRKPTRSRLSLTHHANKSAVEQSKIIRWSESSWYQSGRKGNGLWRKGLAEEPSLEFRMNYWASKRRCKRW